MKKPLTGILLGCVIWLTGGVAHAAQPPDRPNVILIFADDLGYADVGCYGAKGFGTPNLDRMAAQGVRFTTFYTGCPVCSGSRAALMTGRHYQRVGLPAVMFPKNLNGLTASEVTIAAILKRLGYVTAIIGKWHLGHLAQFLPTRHGFDSYFGIPYSNDMTIDPKNARFAKDVVFREGLTLETARTAGPLRHKVPLLRGEEVIEYPADQSTLTKRYTEEAARFIRANRDRPFFLYLPHTMPHVPLFASKAYRGRTATLFGDVMEELDWSVGEVLRTVKDCGIDEKTLVIFTSDNGAHQGSAAPLRGRKATMYEGGVRVPCIMRWAGKIPQKRVCDEVAATIDMLPTLAKLAGGQAPADRPIDGKDIRPLLFGVAGAKTPHEYYFLAHGGGAVRSGPWKFYPWPEGQGKKGKKAKQPAPGAPKVQLYDLTQDLSETTNLAERHPEVVARLAAAYERFLADLKKERTSREKKAGGSAR
ncbi:MAG: sulfatase [Gemmataceae bacterium]|nr:sulfatase [Gemmataceae bacterium]